MATERVGVIIGSGVQDDSAGFEGDCLFVDTTPTIHDKRSPRVKTYRLTRQTGRELPPDVPPSYVTDVGDGCGLNSANGYAAARSSDGLKRAIENHIGDAKLVFMNVSPNGGTANGSRPVVEETLTEMAPEDKRIYWIHHLIPINRHKLFTALSDLRRKLSFGIHVLVKHLSTARAIMALDKRESDGIEEIVRNIKATRGDGTFEMIKPLNIDEGAFVEDITNDALLHCATLWNQGRRQLTGQEVERARNNVRHALHEYHRLTEEPLGRLSPMFAGCRTETEVAQAGELGLRERRLNILRRADEVLSLVSDHVLECGRERVADILHESEQRLQEEHQELARVQTSTSGHDIVHNYVVSQRSWVNRVIHKLGLNGKAERGLHGYLSRELRRTIKESLSSALSGLIERFSDATEIPLPHYRLPDGSQIKHDLASLFLQQADDETGLQAVRTEIRKRIHEIIRESLPISVHSDLTFDFDVGQDVVDTQGLVVYSQYDLGDLPGLLHINPGHSRYHRSDAFLKLIAFVVVKDLVQIPELAQIIRREQARNPLDPDVIKDRVRSIREVIIPPFVFTRDDRVNAALMMLAESYFTPDRLEVFRRGYVVATLKYNRIRFNSLDELVRHMNDDERLHVHDAFWNHVARDPRKALTDTENIVLGRATGEAAERLEAIRGFSGRTQWDASAAFLVEAVRTAVAAYTKN